MNEELHFYEEPFFTPQKTILITFVSIVVLLFSNYI